MRLKIDEHGIVVEPSLHDGYVDTITVNPDKSALLACRTSTGQLLKLHLIGVRAFQGNDFRDGNIIAQLWIYQGARIPAEAIESLLFNEHSKKEDVQRLLRALHGSTDYFFHLCPSYGLEVKAICNDVSWEWPCA